MICLFHFQERLSFEIVMHSIKRFKKKNVVCNVKKIFIYSKLDKQEIPNQNGIMNQQPNMKFIFSYVVTVQRFTSILIVYILCYPIQ